MKEIIALFLLSLIYLFVSYIFHVFLFRAGKARFFFLCIAYFLFTYFLYAGALSLHQYLRDRGIYFEFGHADELLVVIFLLSVILTFINIIAVLARRNFKKEDSKSGNVPNSS